MQVAYLAIGLNVGTQEPEGQYHDTFYAVAKRFAIIDQHVSKSEWEGVAERCVQFEVRVADQHLPSILGAVARELKQEAVAYTRPGFESWRLVYRNNSLGHGGTFDEYPIHVGAEQRAAA